MSNARNESESDLRDPLNWFIQHCIARNRQPRWRHMLIEAPEKGGAELHKFERDVNAAACSAMARWPFETSRTPEELEKRGAYYDGEGPFALMMQHAIARLTPLQHDALFVAFDCSFAVFFHHEGQVWRYPAQ
jgi:hypothetical protein